MGRSLSLKVLTAVAVGAVLLGQFSPVAAAMLLCIGDGSEPDCCNGSPVETGLEVSARLLDGSDCDCCVTVQAAPPTAGTSTPKASLAGVSGLLRNVALPSGARDSALPVGDPGEIRLSSLRTVVLLI